MQQYGEKTKQKHTNGQAADVCVLLNDNYPMCDCSLPG